MITRNGRKILPASFTDRCQKTLIKDLRSSKDDRELRRVYKVADQIFQDASKLTLFNYCQSKFNLKSSLKMFVPNLESFFQNSIALILKSKLDDLGLSSDVLKSCNIEKKIIISYLQHIGIDGYGYPESESLDDLQVKLDFLENAVTFYLNTLHSHLKVIPDPTLKELYESLKSELIQKELILDQIKTKFVNDQKCLQENQKQFKKVSEIVRSDKALNEIIDSLQLFIEIDDEMLRILKGDDHNVVSYFSQTLPNNVLLNVWNYVKKTMPISIQEKAESDRLSFRQIIENWAKYVYQEKKS